MGRFPQVRQGAASLPAATGGLKVLGALSKAVEGLLTSWICLSPAGQERNSPKQRLPQQLQGVQSLGAGAWRLSGCKMTLLRVRVASETPWRRLMLNSQAVSALCAMDLYCDGC